MLKTSKIRRTVQLSIIIAALFLFAGFSLIGAQDNAQTATSIAPTSTITPIANQEQTIATLQAEENATRARLLIELSRTLYTQNWSLSALLAIEAHSALPDNWSELNLLSLTSNGEFDISHLDSGFRNSSIGIITAMSPNKEILVASENDGQIVRWDLKTEKIIYPILGDLGKSVERLLFSPDGKVFASSTKEYGVSTWNTLTGQREQLLGIGDNGYPLVFTKDSKMLWAINRNQQAALWSLDEQKVVRTVDLSVSTTTSAYNPDDDLFVSISSAQKVTLRRTADLSVVAAFDVEKDQQISSVGLSSDHKSIAAALIDPDSPTVFLGVLVWDVSSGKTKLKKTRLPQGHFSPPYSDEMFAPNSLENAQKLATKFVLFPNVSSDAKWLVVDDPAFTIWDITGSEPVKVTELFTSLSEVRTVAFGNNEIAINQNDEIWLLHLNPSPSSQAFILTDEVVNAICEKIGRNMTLSEWQQYMGNKPYRKTCDQWPMSTDFILTQMQDNIRAAHNQTIPKVPDFSNLLPFALETKNPWIANAFCWYGSIYGSAKIVLPICEAGAQWMPYAADLIDSRGLARALTGDIEGAITDFQFFIDARKSDKLGAYIEEVKRRENWIQSLKAGENPFTKSVLTQLQDQS